MHFLFFSFLVSYSLIGGHRLSVLKLKKSLYRNIMAKRSSNSVGVDGLCALLYCCLHICSKHHHGAKSLQHDVIGNSVPIHTVQGCFHSQIL